MKKLYVNNELVAKGDYVIEEREEAPKYFFKVYYDTSYEPDPCNEWNCKTTFYSNHRQFRFDGECTDEIIEKLRKGEVDGKKYYPVYMFDHSGYTLSKTPFTGFYAKWDSGMLGVAEVDNSDGCADGWFDDFFEELKASMEGQVFGFKVVDELGETVDSMWGFYGKPEDIAESMDAYVSNEYGITLEEIQYALENPEY